MSGVDVLAVIGTMASVIRTDNGNLHPEISALLNDAEEARSAVAALIEAANAYFTGYCLDEAHDEMDCSGTGQWTGCSEKQRDAALALAHALVCIGGQP